MAVFAYVGGIYFFTRTTLNGVVKSLRILVFITMQGARQLMCRPSAEPRPLTQVPLHYSLSSDESEDSAEVHLRLADDQAHLQSHRYSQGHR